MFVFYMYNNFLKVTSKLRKKNSYFIPELTIFWHLDSERNFENIFQKATIQNQKSEILQTIHILDFKIFLNYRSL